MKCFVRITFSWVDFHNARAGDSEPVSLWKSLFPIMIHELKAFKCSNRNKTVDDHFTYAFKCGLLRIHANMLKLPADKDNTIVA